MAIREYDPSAGQAFQGDVSIIPIPGDIKVSTGDEVKPIDGRLILQEGEVSGHHHAISVAQKNFFRAPERASDPTLGAKSPKLLRALGSAGKSTSPTARMYRDPAVPQAMAWRGFITRADLAIAVLVIEGGPALLSHEEHDTIRIPPGNYLIGRQVESAGAEERIVAD